VKVWPLLVRNTLEVLLRFQHTIPFLLYLHDVQNLQFLFDAWAEKLQEQEVFEEFAPQ
jgi:hypothetical protein